MGYLVDTNVLITAKNSFYATDIVPSFWSRMEDSISEGKCIILDAVDEEIHNGNDELAAWLDKKNFREHILRAKEDSEVLENYRTISNEVMGDAVFAQGEKDRFLDGADPWLIAAAMKWGHTIVTFETFAGRGSRKVKIPDIAQRMGANTMDLYTMMRELGIEI